MPDPLVPTRIINKNGVATTVHKTQPKLASQQRSVPAPVVMTEQIEDAITERLNNVLFGTMPLPKDMYRPVLLARLRSLPKRVKMNILDNLERHRGEGHVERMIVSMLYTGQSAETIEDVLHVYDNTNDWGSLVMNIGWSDDGYDVDYGIISKFDWVRAYNGRLSGFKFRMDDDTLPLLKHDTKAQNQVIALIDVIGYLAETDDYVLSGMLVTTEDETLELRDTAFAQLIVDYADRYAEVMALINERKTTDADLLRAILTSSAQPLRDGTL